VKKQTSKGICYLCNGRFSKSGISRHLKACFRENVITNKPDCSHILVEGLYQSQYWLHLEVPFGTTLAKLDLFLRNIWLECCSHLSAFTIAGERYYPEVDDYFDKDMLINLERIVTAGEVFTYEYDFGSTTVLTLKHLGNMTKCFSSREISVLARNEEPQHLCDCCGRIAEAVCADCIYDGSGWLCQVCEADHECGEDALLPVLNSPRVGICAYTGE